MDESESTDAAASSSRRRGRRSKVSRLIDEYGLDGLGERLERRWTADGTERASLRELADEFNRRLLEAVLREAGSQPLDGEVANTYRLLTDDDVSSGDRTRVRRQLERDGVDVEQLRDEFVSYQAVRTYLKNERNASYERAETDRVEAAKDTIDQLRGRTASVTESRLNQLAASGDLSVGTLSAVVDVRLRCDECGEQYTVSELLERGRCECHER